MIIGHNSRKCGWEADPASHGASNNLREVWPRGQIDTTKRFQGITQRNVVGRPSRCHLTRATGQGRCGREVKPTPSRDFKAKPRRTWLGDRANVTYCKQRLKGDVAERSNRHHQEISGHSLRKHNWEVELTSPKASDNSREMWRRGQTHTTKRFQGTAQGKVVRRSS